MVMKYIKLKPGTFIVEMCFNESNKTANDAFRAVVDRYHWGVLYFKNAIRFQVTGVSVVSFMPLRNVWPFQRRFLLKSRPLNSILFGFLIPNLPQSTVTMKINEWKFVYALKNGFHCDDFH